MVLIYGALSSNLVRAILEDNEKEYFGTQLSPIQVKVMKEIITTVAYLATVVVLNLTKIC